MKTPVLAKLSIVGLLGAMVTTLFGGWSQALNSLLILMGLDYITGLLVAGVFHASSKTDTGSLSSIIGFKGIARKVGMLILVAVAYQMDLLINTNFVKDAVCITLCSNEIISLLENFGLMGIKYPKAIEAALDILKTKAEHDTKSGTDRE